MANEIMNDITDDVIKGLNAECTQLRENLDDLKDAYATLNARYHMLEEKYERLDRTVRSIFEP